MYLTPPLEADLLIAGATLVTLDAERRVITDGALAVRGDRILAVGKRAEIAPIVRAREMIDAARFVLAPGCIDAHIHITGDPITRGLPRGGPDAGSRLTDWVIPLFRAQTADDEAVAAQCAALAMMRSGVTAFLEAGTVRHLDAVMEALAGAGIRGRLGEWIEGQDDEAAAVAALEREVERWPGGTDARLAAWPILIGHSTNPDAVWRAAKALADECGGAVSAHMSARAADPEWFLAHHGERPLIHLARIGALGPNVRLTHLADVNDAELDALAASGAMGIVCPRAALDGAFGLARIGRHPEMVERGVGIALGTDGLAGDILSEARLMAGLYRDARVDQRLFGPAEMLEMAIANGARALRMEHLIGSLQVGKKADLVLHDADLPEWGPLFDPAGQLAAGAPARGVNSVWVDGVRLIEAGRATWVDEAELAARARRAGAAVLARSGLPNLAAWPPT